MKSSLVSLKKNEDFKSLLSGKKVSNKYSTIFFKRLSNKELYTRYKEYLQENFGADYKCTIKQFALKMNVFINQDIKNTDIIKITKPSNKITYNINFELLLKFFGLTHNSIEIINQDSSNQDSDSDSDSIEIDT